MDKKSEREPGSRKGEKDTDVEKNRWKITVTDKQKSETWRKRTRDGERH